jgi:hypothetical protein
MGPSPQLGTNSPFGMVSGAQQMALGSPVGSILGSLAVQLVIVTVLVAATLAVFRRQEL